MARSAARWNPALKPGVRVKVRRLLKAGSPSTHTGTVTWMGGPPYHALEYRRDGTGGRVDVVLADVLDGYYTVELLEDATTPGSAHDTPEPGDMVRLTITGKVDRSCSLPEAPLAIRGKERAYKIYLDEADSVEVIERAEKLEDYHVYEDAGGRRYLYSSVNEDRPFLHVCWSRSRPGVQAVGFDVPARPLRDLTKAEGK